MKHPNWNEYINHQKWSAITQEIELVTHNGTTKDDLLNMIKFMHSLIKEALEDNDDGADNEE